MRRVVLPTIRTKHLDTPVHTLLSCFHALSRGYHAALLVNSANAIFLPLLRSAGLPVALNVDGIERQRSKWGRVGRSVYALSERLSCVLPDALVTDAEVIRRYYQNEYRAPSWTIAYGVDPVPPGHEEVLDEVGARKPSLLPLREPLRTREQPPPRGGGVPESARRPAAGDGRRSALRHRAHPTNETKSRCSCSLSGSRSTGTAIESSSLTPQPTSTPQRWVEPTPRW